MLRFNTERRRVCCVLYWNQRQYYDDIIDALSPGGIASPGIALLICVSRLLCGRVWNAHPVFAILVRCVPLTLSSR